MTRISSIRCSQWNNITIFICSINSIIIYINKLSTLKWWSKLWNITTTIRHILTPKTLTFRLRLEKSTKSAYIHIFIKMLISIPSKEQTWLISRLKIINFLRIWKISKLFTKKNITRNINIRLKRNRYSNWSIINILITILLKILLIP